MRSRVAGLVAEGFAETVDGGVEAVLEVDEGAIGPEFAADFFAGEDFGGAREQHGEDLERLCVQLDANALAAEFASCRVELEDSEAVERGWLVVDHDCNSV